MAVDPIMRARLERVASLYAAGHASPAGRVGPWPISRFTIRLVGVAALLMAGLYFLLPIALDRPPRNPTYPELMAEFCTREAEFMEGRAAACRAGAARNAPWDDPGEEADALKVCPYPNDVPGRPSWAEQAAVWDRAAARSRRAAAWFARRWW